MRVDCLNPVGRAALRFCCFSCERRVSVQSLAGSSSGASASSKPRVEGLVQDDGRILCTCGKKCGQASDGQVEFACQCGNRVVIDSHILFLRTCEKSIDSIHKGINSITDIVNLMASKQRSMV